MTRFTKVITANGKVHKLRDGAVCRNCKCDLSLENWSVGQGNICKMNITRHDARVCGHGDNKRLA